MTTRLIALLPAANAAAASYPDTLSLRTDHLRAPCVELAEASFAERPAPRRRSAALWSVVATSLCAFSFAPAHALSGGPLLFADDFESGLGAWIVSDDEHVALVDSGDPAHGKVLELRPAGHLLPVVMNRLLSRPPADPVFGLIRGSDAWPAYRLEGLLYFEEPDDSYLGVLYHYHESEGRADFGSVYVIAKPEERYVRVNPHFDWNPARALYEELRVDLPAAAGLEPERWVPFALEVVGRSAHFFVGDLNRPCVTFASFPGERGLAGLSPRVIGGTVRVDDVRVSPIQQHRYAGPPLPTALVPGTDGLVTEWEALGPFHEPLLALEDGERSDGWERFPADERGAVVAAELLEHRSGRRFGYFRTRLHSGSRLELSTAATVAIWVDGSPAELEGPGVGRFDFRRRAWFDFREGPQVWVELTEGAHEVLVRVESDYSGTGFFARTRP